MQDEYIRQCDNFLLVYSITSLQTFEKVKDIYQKILRLKGDLLDDDEQIEVNIVLVSNKCDLLSRLDPIDRLQSESIIILVYGYMHRNERKLNIGFIPEEIKKLCASYIDKSSAGKRIEVTSEMGIKLAKSWESDGFKVPFIETSPKERTNVHQAFEHLVRLSDNARRNAVK